MMAMLSGALDYLLRPAARYREFQGVRNPQGLRVGYAGVGVWVGNLYPQQTPTLKTRVGVLAGFSHGYSIYRHHAKCYLMQNIVCFKNDVVERILGPAPSEVAFGTVQCQKKGTYNPHPLIIPTIHLIHSNN